MSSEKINFNKLERVTKGYSNHRRIEMMFLLKNKPELSLIDVVRELNINFKTASEHMRRLTIAGLIIKRHDGNSVRHKLTTQGETILKFLRTLE